jgi:hypothetical protein
MRIGLCALATLALGLVAVPRTVTAQSPDSCVKYWGEARYGALGYNHLVHIANSCGVPADCVVSTDVAPAPLSQAVAAKSEAVVTTFLGSPARGFTPHVKCTMRDK